MQNFIVTGANQGLGLAIARALHRDPGSRVVLAVRDVDRGAAAAQSIGPRAEARRLDLASLADVERFASEWRGQLAGLVNNAGVQQIDGTHRTIDGWEETIAVNHLGALALTLQLLPALEGGRVLFIGSGTHNPRNRAATLFGFRGARFTSIPALASGKGEAEGPRQLGMDRYATSKFLNMVTAMELARRVPHRQTAFFTLDPGLMAGTGLARTAPGVQRLLWSTLLR
jgi:NAD(P)-dependent dehydrogenase (short-subunit alcohol dehydrogenase family)